MLSFYIAGVVALLIVGTAFGFAVREAWRFHMTVNDFRRTVDELRELRIGRKTQKGPVAQHKQWWNRK